MFVVFCWDVVADQVSATDNLANKEEGVNFGSDNTSLGEVTKSQTLQGVLVEVLLDV